MGLGKDLKYLIRDIGYEFNDVTYLENALTHASYVNEMRKKGFRCDSNESLEFLGDAILEFLISEELFARFKRDGEGALTKMRQELVCESTLAKLAEDINLGDYLHIATSEEGTRLRTRPKVLADTFEALIAAIYLDDKTAGAHYYKDIILSFFTEEISARASGATSDYKTMLQKFVEKNGDVLRYDCEESGPDHEKTFVSTAFINNNKVGVGSGFTKRSAEQSAAMAALRLFGMI